MSDPESLATTALLLLDLQNDFLHPDGAYARAGQNSPAIAALPARLKPLADAVRRRGGLVAATLFTLVPGRRGEPIISPHLKKLRPFLDKGDFAPGSWGQQLVDTLAPADVCVEKIAYSAFYMSRLEWVLRQVRHRAGLRGRHCHQRRRCFDRSRCSRARIRLHGPRRRLRRILRRGPSRRHRRIAADRAHHDGGGGDRRSRGCAGGLGRRRFMPRQHLIAENVAAYFPRAGHGEFLEAFDGLRQFVVGDLPLEKSDCLVQ